jgi:hypothetical protein
VNSAGFWTAYPRQKHCRPCEIKEARGAEIGNCYCVAVTAGCQVRDCVGMSTRVTNLCKSRSSFQTSEMFLGLRLVL